MSWRVLGIVLGEKHVREFRKVRSRRLPWVVVCLIGVISPVGRCDCCAVGSAVNAVPETTAGTTIALGCSHCVVDGVAEGGAESERSAPCDCPTECPDDGRDAVVLVTHEVGSAGERCAASVSDGWLTVGSMVSELSGLRDADFGVTCRANRDAGSLCVWHAIWLL